MLCPGRERGGNHDVVRARVGVLGGRCFVGREMLVSIVRFSGMERHTHCIARGVGYLLTFSVRKRVRAHVGADVHELWAEDKIRHLV